MSQNEIIMGMNTDRKEERSSRTVPWITLVLSGQMKRNKWRRLKKTGKSAQWSKTYARRMGYAHSPLGNKAMEGTGHLGKCCTDADWECPQGWAMWSLSATLTRQLKAAVRMKTRLQWLQEQRRGNLRTMSTDSISKKCCREEMMMNGVSASADSLPPASKPHTWLYAPSAGELSLTDHSPWDPGCPTAHVHLNPSLTLQFLLVEGLQGA